MSDSDDPITPVDEGGGDDLFGDDDAEAVPSDVGRAPASPPARDEESDDEELLPMDEDGPEPLEFRRKTIHEVFLYRHRIPKSEDGSIQSLKVPKFIKISPVEYKDDEWEPNRWDLENAKKEKPAPKVLFRREPTTGRMQSNTNIYRWSDGSVTIAIGDEHYEMQTKQLAPPRDKPYQEVHDAHYYAAVAQLTTNSLVVVGHFNEQYTVRPNQDITDDAVERLKAGLAGLRKDRGAEMIIATTEDPELQMKQAEMAEKERTRAQRRRETVAARVDGFGGGAGARYKGGALSIGDIETGRRPGGAAGRKRGMPGGGRKKGRRPEYDSDDDLPQGARRADNYDMEDGFLVDSDNESEDLDDEDEDDILDDGDEEEEEEEERRPRQKRQKTSNRVNKDADADAVADGVVTSSQPTERNGHHRRRNVIDDDEDDE